MSSPWGVVPIATSELEASLTRHGLMQQYPGGVVQFLRADGNFAVPLTLGQAITDELGLYGVTPIPQRAGAAQAAVPTTAATSTTPFGYTTAAQADAIVTLLNELRAALVVIGAIKGAA